MMTMYDPVFPTVKQVVNSVKRGLSLLKSWRKQRRNLQYLSDIPEHLRDDLGLDGIADAARPTASEMAHKRP